MKSEVIRFELNVDNEFKVESDNLEFNFEDDWSDMTEEEIENWIRNTKLAGGVFADMVIFREESE